MRKDVFFSMTNSLAIESFIEHCDEMLIAEEGIKEVAGAVKNGAVTAGKAVGHAGAVAGKNIAFAMKTAADKVITMVKRILNWFKTKIFEIKSKKDDSALSKYTKSVGDAITNAQGEIKSLWSDKDLTSEKIDNVSKKFSEAYAAAKKDSTKASAYVKNTQNDVIRVLQEDYTRVSKLLKEASQFRTMANNPNQSEEDRAEAQNIFNQVKLQLKLAQLALKVDSKMLNRTETSGTVDK